MAMNQYDFGENKATQGTSGEGGQVRDIYVGGEALPHWMGLSRGTPYWESMANAIGVDPSSIPEYGVTHYNMDEFSPEQMSNLNKEYERQKKIAEATHKRKVYQGLAKVAGLMAVGAAGGALGGGFGGAAGGASAGAGSAAAGTGAAGAGAGAAGAGAAALPAGYGTAGGLGVGAGLGGATGAGLGGGAAAGVGAGLGGTTAVTSGGGLTLAQGLKYANAAQKAYGAYAGAKEQAKVAEDAAKDKTTTQFRTPYYNEAIAPLIQYFLQEAQKIYASRLQQYGLKPGDYSPYSALLSGIPLQYSGVGQPGSAQMNQTWR